MFRFIRQNLKKANLVLNIYSAYLDEPNNEYNKINERKKANKN